MSQNRVQAGVREGGQFATDPKVEPGLELDTSTEPVPLTHVVLDGEALQLTDFEHGDPVFCDVTVTRNGDGSFCVEGDVQIDFIDGLDEHARRSGLYEGEPGDEEREKLAVYLQTRELVVNGWMQAQYGVDRIVGDDWDTSRPTFATELPPDATTADITQALRDNTKAVALHNESDPGTFGSRNMWQALHAHLVEEDRLATQTMTPLTWDRHFPAAKQSQTWSAQVPVSLLRGLYEGTAQRSDVDQYVCDHGELTDGPCAGAGREWDEVYFQTPDREQLNVVYRPLAPFGPSQAG